MVALAAVPTAVYVALHVPPQFAVVAALGWLATAIGLLLLKRRGSCTWTLACTLAALASIQLNNWQERLLPELCNRQVIDLVGRVSVLPQSVEGRAGLATKLVVEVSEMRPSRCAGPKRVVLYLYDPLVPAQRVERELRVGDQLRAQVRMRRPWGTVNPLAMTGSKREMLKGVHAIGSVRAYQDPVPASETGLLVTFQQLRAALGSRLREELRYSHTRALASALALGDSRFLSSDDWLRLRQFALTHLFVISGLHLAVVAGLVWAASSASLRLAMLVGSVPQGWAILPLIITLLAATGYALLSGFSLPVRRALLMLVCALAPSLWSRPVLGTKALCFAATAILSFDPFAVLGSSFWMSFGAVALILWFNLWYVNTAMQGRVASAQTRWLRRLRSFVQLQAYLIVGMAPLSYFFFASAAGLGSLVNFLVVPMVTTVVVPLLLIAVALLPFSEFSTKLLLVPEYLLDKLWRALGYWSIHLPDLDSTVRPLSTSALITTSVLVLTWAARISKHQLPIALLLCAAVLLLRNRVPAPESRVTIFDVGQGLAALVEHENTRILIDTAGQFASGTPIAQQTFSNYLVERARIKHQDKPVLDLLIVSHEDLDHRGGEDFLRSRLHVKQTLRGEWPDGIHSEVADAPVLIGGHLDLFRSLNPNLRQKPNKNQNQTSTEAELCRLGRTMRWPSGLSLRVLSDPANTGTRNDRSCVLLLTIQGYRFLFPGDIGSGVERALTAYWRDELKADVLIAGHHGSASSSSRLWLKWVEPRRFVVSAGYENAFGHPAAEVLDRVESSQASVISTAERGAIVFDLSEEGDLRCRALRHRWAPTWRWAAQKDRC